MADFDVMATFFEPCGGAISPMPDETGHAKRRRFVVADIVT
jgi:hypothetical protein